MNSVQFKMGSWCWDPRSDRLECSPALVELLGLNSTLLPYGIETLQRRVHVEDELRFIEWLAEWRAKGRAAQTLNCRLLTAAEEGRWFALSGESGQFCGDLHGKLVGTLVDIHEVMMNQRRLRLAEEISGMGHWELEVASQRLFLSDRLLTMLGLDLESSPSLADFLALISDEERPFMQQLFQVLQHGEQNRIADLLMGFRLGQGGVVLMELSMIAHTAPNGVVERVVGTMADVTRRQQELESYQNDMLNYALKLDHTVQQRTHELERTLAELQQATQAKSLFLAHMSHEMRTPLHGILSFASMGERRLAKLSPEQVRDYFIHIQRSGERLLGWINDLLDMSRLESHTLELEPQPQLMAVLVEQVVVAINSTLQVERLVIQPVSDPQLAGEWDPTRLVQALMTIGWAVVNEAEAGSVVEINYRPILTDRVELTLTNCAPPRNDQELNWLYHPERLHYTRPPGSEAVAHNEFKLTLACRIILAHQGTLEIQRLEAGNRYRMILPQRAT